MPQKRRAARKSSGSFVMIGNKNHEVSSLNPSVAILFLQNSYFSSQILVLL